MHDHLHCHGASTSAPAGNSHLGSIATESMDVIPDPFESGVLVQETGIPRAIGAHLFASQKPQGPQPVLQGDIDH